MRLIDADALAEKLNALHGDGDYEANIYCAEPCYGLGNWIWENPEDYGLEEAIKELEAAPTIDAVPIVRCKDCVYWERGDCYRLELSLPDDFCSYGKRK